MLIKTKKFDDLTIKELYKILELRSEVFVVEQECIYNDIDGKDLDSIHIWAEVNGEIVGYIRVLKKGVSYASCSIGRVLVKKDFRSKDIARKLVSEGITYITETLKEDSIIIGAQVYLRAFYESFGFKGISEDYDEDGILHLDMKYTK